MIVRKKARIKIAGDGNGAIAVDLLCEISPSDVPFQTWEGFFYIKRGSLVPGDLLLRDTLFLFEDQSQAIGCINRVTPHRDVEGGEMLDIGFNGRGAPPSALLHRAETVASAAMVCIHGRDG
jgi:hypothetical protein